MSTKCLVNLMNLRSATLAHVAYLHYMYVYHSNDLYGCRPDINPSNSITHEQGKNKQMPTLGTQGQPV